MPWIVGIDEAGYGPNLGPFVMTSVACHVPERHGGGDLWELLRPAARRHGEPPDHRFVVADSKLVYSQNAGFGQLEQAVHAALQDCQAATCSHVVERVCPLHLEELRAEPWFDGTTALPVAADAEACLRSRQILGELCQRLEVGWGYIQSTVVCPGPFNALLDKWGTKGAVLAMSLVRLLRALPVDEQPLLVFIDKHGGRNHYTATLQPAFDDGLVIAHLEGSQRSVYRVEGGDRHIEVTFQPRADAEHFCVALASMVSKYLREVLMLEFNRFWQAKIPGLKATAGYPLDARRYWNEIRETAAQLGLPDDAMWRRK